jgi:hypothetical protein
MYLSIIVHDPSLIHGQQLCWMLYTNSQLTKLLKPRNSFAEQIFLLDSFN